MSLSPQNHPSPITSPIACMPDALPAIESDRHVPDESQQSIALLPLVVDLDGTLTLTDTLAECMLLVIKRQPWRLWQMLYWLLLGRATLKAQLAILQVQPLQNCPWRADFATFLREQHRGGRRLVLATAAARPIAQAVADHFGFFDHVLSSDERRNLKGRVKRDAIVELLGHDFVYAGDSAADLPIWQAASAAIVVNVGARLERRIQVPIERRFNPAKADPMIWLRALRVHQSLKNLLLFVPLFVSFQFGEASKVMAALLAFVSFSLTASATYIANDLWDLESDRAHPRKRERPFASGALKVADGVAVAALLLLAGALSAFWVSPGFFMMLLVYVGLTTAYSWSLKQYVLMDVLCLASLYTWRVLAGAVAVSVVASPWLLAFSIFLFGSLALVKRCAELVSLQSSGKQASSGRDYSVGDLVILWPLGVGLGVSAVVVFGLYVGSVGAASLYNRGELLWAVGLCLIYWIGRLWIKTARGEMHDDPVVFALRDRGSRFVLGAMILITLIAHWST